MRGKAPAAVADTPKSGITPAYAGKRAKKSVMQSAGRDHPRLCGEKICPDETGVKVLGSPPPMRGKDHVPATTIAIPRITPAYAGKRFAVEFKHGQRRDHPRLCGEKSSSWILHSATVRITPAYAGKS